MTNGIVDAFTDSLMIRSANIFSRGHSSGRQKTEEDPVFIVKLHQRTNVN